jgi:hypothetical protein
MPATNRNTSTHRDYWHGHYWPSGWIGPTVSQSDPKYSERMAALERVFQSANVLRECAQNWRDGLLSEPFTWFLKAEGGDRANTDPDAEDRDETAAAAELELQRWLDHVEQSATNANPLDSTFHQADPWTEFVLSLGVLGEAGLRLWQPERFADDPDPIQRIYLHATRPRSVLIDRSSLDGFIDKITYVSATGNEVQTMVGPVVTVTTLGQDEPIEIDTGGRWLIQYATGESIFTPSVVRLQNALNHALTMMVRNTEVAGFREKVFGNAEYPTDADGNPIAIESGPGTDTYLYGVPTGDAANPGTAPVSVFQSEPVDNSSLMAAVETYRRLIYMEFAQGHLISTGTGTLSGESRIQQRAQFELNLRGWKRRIEAAIASILNIVLRLLEVEGYEVVVSLNVTTGKLSHDERASVVAEYQAGLLSKATALARLGVADVDAELNLIMEESAEGMQRRDLPNEALPDPLGILAGGE